MHPKWVYTWYMPGNGVQLGQIGLSWVYTWHFFHIGMAQAYTRHFCRFLPFFVAKYVPIRHFSGIFCPSGIYRVFLGYFSINRHGTPKTGPYWYIPGIKKKCQVYTILFLVYTRYFHFLPDYGAGIYLTNTHTQVYTRVQGGGSGGGCRCI